MRQLTPLAIITLAAAAAAAAAAFHDRNCRVFLGERPPPPPSRRVVLRAFAPSLAPHLPRRAASIRNFNSSSWVPRIAPMCERESRNLAESQNRLKLLFSRPRNQYSPSLDLHRLEDCAVVIISLFCGGQGIFSQSFFSLGSIWQLKLPLHSSTHPSAQSSQLSWRRGEKGEDKIDADSLSRRQASKSLRKVRADDDGAS